MTSVREHAERADRDPGEMDFAYSEAWYDDSSGQFRADGNRRVFTGSDDRKPTTLFFSLCRLDRCVEG